MPKTKHGKRHQARSLALQVLYGLSFSTVKSEEDLRKAYLDYPENSKEGDAIKEVKEPEGFSWELIQGVYTHLDAIDEQIKRFTLNWRFDRIGHIELTLLRLAVFELMFCRETPARVVINEALELGSDFAADNCKKFINGILDAIVKELEKNSS